MPTAEVLAMRLEVIDGWLGWEVDLRLPNGFFRRVVLNEIDGDRLVERALEEMPPLSLQRFARVP